MNEQRNSAAGTTRVQLPGLGASAVHLCATCLASARIKRVLGEGRDGNCFHCKGRAVELRVYIVNEGTSWSASVEEVTHDDDGNEYGSFPYNRMALVDASAALKWASYIVRKWYGRKLDDVDELNDDSATDVL